MHRRIVDGQVQQSTDGVTWVNIADLTDEQLIARLTDEQLVEIEHEQRLTISVEDEAFLARHVPALLAEIRALKTKLNPPRIEWLDDSGQVPWPPKEGAVSLKNSEVILHVATELMKGALSNPSIGLLQLQTRDLLGLVGSISVIAEHLVESADRYPRSRRKGNDRLRPLRDVRLPGDPAGRTSHLARSQHGTDLARVRHLQSVPRHDGQAQDG